MSLLLWNGSSVLHPSVSGFLAPEAYISYKPQAAGVWDAAGAAPPSSPGTSAVASSLLTLPPPPPPPLFSLSKPPSVPSRLLFLEHCSTTSLLGFRSCGIFFLVYRLKSRPLLTPQFPSQVPFLPHLHSPASGPNAALTFGRASEPQGG